MSYDYTKCEMNEDITGAVKLSEETGRVLGVRPIEMILTE